MERLYRMWKFVVDMTTLKTFPLFLAYMAMTTFGPRLMKRYTKPVELRSVLILYNMLCSLISLYTLYGMVTALQQEDYVYLNAPTKAMIAPLRLYRLTKGIELLDTVFMMLRHKWRQISFLHVYHHSLMLVFVDFAVTYYPYLSMIPGLALNAFVHVILYFYYGYSACFPGDRPVWKKRITEIQIVQFIIDLAYSINGLVYHGFCMWSFVYPFSMLYLFSKFYLKAYVNPRSSKSDPKAAAKYSNHVTKGE